MDRINKKKLFSLKKADAAADIGLINQFSMKELAPEDVYCFSVVLCDNEVDRDFERFTNDCLDKLAPLFVGKSGLFDHYWSANAQNSRLYRVETAITGEMTSLGEQKRVLRGDAYMLKMDETESLIELIEGGIVKEVSVGVRIEKCLCSICSEVMGWSRCENGHQKGKKYDDKLCYGSLSEPLDAYEFSFVAVPAQRGAGVTKSYSDINDAFEILLQADLSQHMEICDKLSQCIAEARQTANDVQKRREILKENQKYLQNRKDSKHDTI